MKEQVTAMTHNMPNTVRVYVQTDDDTRPPEYQTSGSAGADLRATAKHVLAPGDWALIGTGLRMAIPRGFEGQVRTRSGLALKRGLVVLNAPGTIDSDYRGEIGVILCNQSKQTQTIAPGERIAQLVLAQVAQAYWMRVEESIHLPQSERGEGGFGSTGNA